MVQKKSTVFLIFGKGQAAQLDALLHSTALHGLDAAQMDVHVIFDAAEPAQHMPYEQLHEQHSQVHYTQALAFNDQLLDLLSRYSYVLFSAEELRFISPFSIAHIGRQLEKHIDALCFSLQPESPAGLPGSGTEQKIRWAGALQKENPALPLLQSVYRTDDLLRLLRAFPNRDAAALAHQWQTAASLYAAGKGYYLTSSLPYGNCGPHTETHASTVSASGIEQTEKGLHLPKLAEEMIPFLYANKLARSGGEIRLHLGCGEQYFQGYINLDYPPEHHNVMNIKADVLADVLELRFPVQSIDEIRLHHVFEHFNRVTALGLLIRWQQWLRVGGVLHIETPDLMGSAYTLATTASFDVKMSIARHLAGDQAADWAYHVDHWFPERFKKTLEMLGFEMLSIVSYSWTHEPYLSNVEVKAKKTRNLSFEELLAAADSLLWESTVSPVEVANYEIWKQNIRIFLK